MVENQLGLLFSQIAESIRGGLGNIGTMKPNSFPAKIDDIVALIGTGGGDPGGESGSGGALTFASGSFSPGADGERVTINHGLGVMPDLVIVHLSSIHHSETFEEAAESLALVASWGMKSSFQGSAHSGNIHTIYGITRANGIDNTSEEDKANGFIYCPDETCFQVGSTKDTGKLYAANSYKWIAISGIGGGVSEPVIEPLEVTKNGTYTAPDGVDGYSPVTVAVPAPEIKLQEKTATVNGTYTADSGFDGLSKVLVNVAASGGTLVGAKGTFKVGTGTTSYMVSHNLGTVPIAVLVYPTAGFVTSTAIDYSIWALFGLNREAANACGLTMDMQYGMFWMKNNNFIGATSPDYGIDESGGLIKNASVSTFVVGGGSYKINPNTEYTWVAIGIKKG